MFDTYCNPLRDMLLHFPTFGMPLLQQLLYKPRMFRIRGIEKILKIVFHICFSFHWKQISKIIYIVNIKSIEKCFTEHAINENWAIFRAVVHTNHQTYEKYNCANPKSWFPVLELTKTNKKIFNQNGFLQRIYQYSLHFFTWNSHLKITPISLWYIRHFTFSYCLLMIKRLTYRKTDKFTKFYLNYVFADTWPWPSSHEV